jgi:hypothetical protein
MSRALDTRAETLKLARLLAIDPERIAFVAKLDPAVARELREQVTDVLFDSSDPGLQRAARGGRALPAQVTALIAQRAFGPLLCARIAGAMDPERAVEIAKRLPAPFLAEVAIELDPRRASDVIARVPTRTIAEVAHELVARGEHVTMGRFAGHLPTESLAAAIEVIDDRSLLRIGLVTEGKERLDEIIGLLSDERLRGLIATADAEGMWPEALELFSHASTADGVSETQRKVAQMAAEDEHVLAAAVKATVEHGLWAELLPLVPYLPEHGKRLVADVASGDPEAPAEVSAR